MLTSGGFASVALAAPTQPRPDTGHGNRVTYPGYFVSIYITTSPRVSYDVINCFHDKRQFLFAAQLEAAIRLHHDAFAYHGPATLNLGSPGGMVTHTRGTVTSRATSSPVASSASCSFPPAGAGPSRT